jgi:hypothetical protein
MIESCEVRTTDRQGCANVEQRQPDSAATSSLAQLEARRKTPRACGVLRTNSVRVLRSSHRLNPTRQLSVRLRQPVTTRLTHYWQLTPFRRERLDRLHTVAARSGSSCEHSPRSRAAGHPLQGSARPTNLARCQRWAQAAARAWPRSIQRQVVARPPVGDFKAPTCRGPSPALRRLALCGRGPARSATAPAVRPPPEARPALR